MAKASDVCYSIGGDLKADPSYAGVGFTSVPAPFVDNEINAALVGVTNTEIVVAFRGTLPLDLKDWDSSQDWDAFIESILDWLNDAKAKPVKVDYCDGSVHTGFSESLEALWSGVAGAVHQQLGVKPLPVVVTGHSKGGALATLAAIRLHNKETITPAAVYTYGSPRVGDTPFSKSFNAVIDQWRFENDNDLVPHLPPTAPLLSLLNHIDSRLGDLVAQGYDHAGMLEYLDSDGDRFQGDPYMVLGPRIESFVKLLVTGRVKQVATDHSIADQYIPKICKLSQAAGAT
jgi:hypothetical protein